MAEMLAESFSGAVGLDSDKSVFDRHSEWVVIFHP